jgi:thiol-disulfide isomerase/thioredoxin
MSSIVKLRVLICTLGIAAAATLGCRPSPRTQPANGGADDGASVAKPNVGEQTMPDPANADQPTSGAPEIAPPGPSQVPEVSESSTTLGIGDPAPALSIDRCVTGEPIDKLDAGQVYVIEFWATWCPPCRTSMPHLSQLQQQYGDKVQFVGVTGETEDTVRSFLAKEESPGRTWAEVVKYRLVIDSQAATDAAYMRAAGQTGIPTAFIVGRDGVVEWIGHPLSMDEPLAKIVANDWDREAAVAQFKQQMKLQETSRELNNLMRAGSWDQALALIDQLEKESSRTFPLSNLKLSILEKAGRADAAAKLRAELVEQSWDDAMALNEMAWGIATRSGERDLELAYKAAQRASELRGHKDAAILDTLARVFYEQGQLDKAIEWQRKACEQNLGEPSIDAALKKYEAEKASRSSDSGTPAQNEAGAAKGPL